MTEFFTSDHHFYHKNVLKFEDRPFSNIHDMNEGMIKSWNNTVGKNDIVHHLGDFCFGGYDKWTSILDRLNGRIILYKGNHDDSKTLKRLAKSGYFEKIHQVGDYIKVNKMQLWLTHYPMEIGLRPRKFSIHGHIHGEPSNMINQINVGVDSQIREKLSVNGEFGQPIHIDDLMRYIELVNPTIEKDFQRERAVITKGEDNYE